MYTYSGRAFTITTTEGSLMDFLNSVNIPMHKCTRVSAEDANPYGMVIRLKLRDAQDINEIKKILDIYFSKTTT